MEAIPHFWSPDNFGLDDELNRRIWDESPRLQRDIQVQQDVLSAGAIGAQQAMVCEQPLPWVPDIIGKESRAEDGVLIVGSAYAGFISEHSTRARTMPLDVRRCARTPQTFKSNSWSVSSVGITITTERFKGGRRKNGGPPRLHCLICVV